MSKLQTRVEKLEAQVGAPGEIQQVMAIVGEHQVQVLSWDGQHVDLTRAEYDRQRAEDGVITAPDGRRFEITQAIRGFEPDEL
jgi:hypothetical protein